MIIIYRDINFYFKSADEFETNNPDSLLFFSGSAFFGVMQDKLFAVIVFDDLLNK